MLYEDRVEKIVEFHKNNDEEGFKNWYLSLNSHAQSLVTVYLFSNYKYDDSGILKQFLIISNDINEIS